VNTPAPLGDRPLWGKLTLRACCLGCGIWDVVFGWLGFSEYRDDVFYFHYEEAIIALEIDRYRALGIE